MFQFQRFTIHQDQCAMKVGTDGVLLGAWAQGGERVLDIGTGTGVIALMMAQRYAEAHVVAVDIDEAAVRQARQNADASPFGDRVEVVLSSIQDYATSCSLSFGEGRGEVPAHFDSIVCNPPFFVDSLKAPDQQRSLARHADTLPFAELMRAAYRLLSDDGDLSVVIPFDCRRRLDDEAFLALAHKRVDTGALMRYLLFFEAAALGDDNTKNNLYFWCVHRDGRQLYYLSPWDMDQGFNDHGSVGGDVNFSLALPIRLLTLDAPGCREALWRDWKAFREGVLSESAVYEWMDGIESEMNASGAMLRESERWPGRPDRMDLMADRVYLLEHLEALDRDFKNLWPLPETEAAP